MNSFHAFQHTSLSWNHFKMHLKTPVLPAFCFCTSRGTYFQLTHVRVSSSHQRKRTTHIREARIGIETYNFTPANKTRLIVKNEWPEAMEPVSEELAQRGLFGKYAIFNVSNLNGYLSISMNWYSVSLFHSTLSQQTTRLGHHLFHHYHSIQISTLI